jgi:hypothetical protein
MRERSVDGEASFVAFEAESNQRVHRLRPDRGSFEPRLRGHAHVGANRGPATKLNLVGANCQMGAMLDRLVRETPVAGARHARPARASEPRSRPRGRH